MKINLGTEAEFMERVKQEFSPEVTEEECMEFLASCPYQIMPSDTLVMGYIMARVFHIPAGKSPYQSLLVVMKSLWETNQEMNDEN